MIAHIFQYHIAFHGDSEFTEIKLPSGFQVCDINTQGGRIVLWAMVNIHAPLEAVRFKVVGTGWQIKYTENLYFMKTVHMPDGLVWHVFSVD